MSRHVVEFELTHRIDRVESRVWLNPIELGWPLSIQPNPETQLGLGWEIRTRRQV